MAEQKLVQLPSGGFEVHKIWLLPSGYGGMGFSRGQTYSPARWRDEMRQLPSDEARERVISAVAEAERKAALPPPTPPERPMELWEIEQAKKVEEQKKEERIEEEKIKEAVEYAEKHPEKITPFTVLPGGYDIGEITRKKIRVEPLPPPVKRIALAGIGIPSIFEPPAPVEEKRREPGVEEVITAGIIGVRLAGKAYREEIPSDIVGILPSEKKKGYDIMGEIPFFETKRRETIKAIGKEIIKISRERIEVKVYENGKLISSTSRKAPQGEIFDIEAIKADARTRGMKVKGSTIEAPIRERLIIEEAVPTEEVSLLIGRARDAPPFVSKKTKEEIEKAYRTTSALQQIGLHAHTLLSPAGKEYIGALATRLPISSILPVRPRKKIPLEPVVKKRLGVLLERGKAGRLTFPGLAVESVLESPVTEITTAYWLGTGIARLGVTKIGAKVLAAPAARAIGYGALTVGMGIKAEEIARLRREERRAEAIGTTITTGASLFAGYVGYQREYERLHPKRVLEAVALRREEARIERYHEKLREYEIFKEPVKSKWVEAIPRKEITDVATKGKTVRETADYIIKTYKGTEVLLMKKSTGLKETTKDIIDVLRIQGRYAGGIKGMDVYIRQSHYLPVTFKKPPAKEFKPLAVKGKPRSDILQWLSESYRKTQAAEDKRIAEQIAKRTLQQFGAIERATRAMLKIGVRPEAPPGIKTFIGIKAPAPRFREKIVSETDFIGLQTIQRKEDTMELLYPTKLKVKQIPKVPELIFKPPKLKLEEKVKARQALLPRVAQREIIGTDLKQEIKEFQEYMPPTRLRIPTRIRERLKKETVLEETALMPSYEDILFPSLDLFPPAPLIPFLPRFPRPSISGGFLERGFDFILPGKRRKAYVPSLIAMEFDIFGEEPKGILTGVEIRPMIRRKKKKGKRKRTWLL